MFASKPCELVRKGPTRLHSQRIAPKPIKCAPKWNPQNVENVKIMPSPSFSPSDAVKVQLEAISNNDEPWMNHGLQTMYEYADEAGSMELSGYFRGIRVDLYHFDHFMGKFQTKLAPFMRCQGWKEVDTRPEKPQPGYVEVDIQVTDGNGQDAGVYTFTMVQRQIGRKTGCWMTSSIGKKA